MKIHRSIPTKHGFLEIILPDEDYELPELTREERIKAALRYAKNRFGSNPQTQNREPVEPAQPRSEPDDCKSDKSCLCSGDLARPQHR